MTRPILKERNGWRGVQLALVVLALALKVILPPGFMPSTPGSGAAFPLMICTGQGALVVASKDAGGKQGAPDQPTDQKSGHDAPCAFAGHAAVAIAPTFSAAPVMHAISIPAVVGLLSDLQPGRGLAAPPPPSQGPPVVLS